ncbi:MAG TPA: ABC transporter permease, partial [Mucilaginibacter sp.]|nr:ABC transporter permease [Mucilaginibacter sp.]
DELSFDHSFKKRNEIFSVRMNISYGGRIESFTAVPGPMADAIKATIPGVRNVSRIRGDRQLFSLGDKSIYGQGSFVDSGFLSMMMLPFVYGNGNGAIRQVHSIILTETMSRKFFGEVNPVGKSLRMNNEQDYTVTGVIRDLPSNVSVYFEWLAPVENFLVNDKWLESWGNFGITTFVELTPGTKVSTVNQQMTALLRPKDKEYTQANCLLWSMNDWHLYDDYTDGKQSGGQIKYVKLFSLIAWIILVIACINFMNLATARAGQRAKEVGIRKTLGALRRSLIGQFIGESLILSFLSVLLAVTLVYLLLPGFNTLVDKELPFTPLEPLHLITLLVIGVFCGLIAGSYPAFYLSSFRPVAVLKGLRIRANAGAGFIRKGLVITQFSVSVVLIVCTVIIYQQVQHVKNRDLGYDKQNLLYLYTQGKMIDRFATIKTELLASGVVDNAATAFSPPLQMWSNTNTSELLWEGSDPTKKIQINWETVSPEYVATMGLRVTEGRDFYGDVKADSATCLINETMAKIMGKAGHV